MKKKTDSVVVAVEPKDETADKTSDGSDEDEDIDPNYKKTMRNKGKKTDSFTQLKGGDRLYNLFKKKLEKAPPSNVI